MAAKDVSYRLHNGLATYSVGEGEPILLMPYPHGYTTSPMAEGALALTSLELGCRLITFDPPGAFRSTRPAEVSMPEMLGSAEETFQVMDIGDPLSVIGHSMGGLCAIAYTLARPTRVKQLVVIGTISGGPAIARCKGMPWGMRRTALDFWRFVYWGFQLSSGVGNMAVHKKLLRLIWQWSYVDKSLIPNLEIEPEDRHRPAPVRDKWPKAVRQLDYSKQLKEIVVPTLVCVGRHDPQAPVACSEEVAQGIPDAFLVIFEQSGHYPFVEERQQFQRALFDFLVL